MIKEGSEYMSKVQTKYIRVIMSLFFLWSPLAWSFQGGRSFFLARPQGEHAEREIVGWQDTINLATDCENYASFAFYPGYSRSIRPSHIVEYFFGCSQPLIVSGAKIPDRGELDILADYFGLPQDFKSTVQFSPLVQNTNVDVNLFIGLDEFWSGSYFRMHLPFVNSSWNMRIAECV